MQLIVKTIIRRLISILMISLLIFNLQIAFASSFENTNISVVIPNKNVVIWGNSYKNLNLKYPVILINGIFYYPLTKEFTQQLSYASFQTSINEIVLIKRSSIGKNMISSQSVGTPIVSSTSQPALVNYPIRLGGYPLYSEKPIYNLSGITYVSLDFTPVLRSQVTYNDTLGIVIQTEVTYTNTYPITFNTYDSIDQSLFVRDQGSAASCWAFAANTIFELAIEKKFHETVNFSEADLIENTPIKSTYVSGGNFQASSIYYLNHKGPITENMNGVVDEKKRMPLYQLDGYIEINNNMDKIKKNILNMGAVLTSIYLNESDPLVYNRATNAYYNSNEKKERTHELVLVGWDDHYSKDNFTDAPDHDGAFIAQNSFGNSWGNNGFFYVSYEDVHIMDYVYALTDITKVSSNKKSFESYYYDTTGVTHYENYNDDALVTGVNVFEAKSNSALRKIGIYNNENDIHVTIYASTGKFSMALNNPPLYETVIKEKGFHTLDLPTPIKLIKNQSFWVGVKYEGRQNFLLPIEAPYPGIEYNVFAAPGQGYIGSSSEFTDITEIRPNASIAIRAFALPTQ
ncbi:lectin like domain-containing protein [Fusibacter bizertensis]